ncbi:MAG: ABC transporter permease, partial [Streptosporangiaceae bacterium]
MFSASAEYRVGTDFLVTGATTHPLTTAWVTPQFFPVLGVRMALGRNLAGATTPRPDQHIASLPVVVSYAIWRDRLGSDPDALGRVIRLKRTYPYRLVVIGVAPAAFDFPPGADLWLPEHLGSFSRIQTAAPPAQLRTTVARLRPGVSRLQAEAAMRSWPHNGRDWIWNDSVRLVSMREFLGGPLYGLAVPVGAAVGLFLLLTVATATGMWRNDLASRRHEISVRQSFGALPSRLLRSTAMELSVVLAGALLLAIGIDVVATRLVSAGFGTAASPAGRLWVADALGAVVVLGVTGGLMLLALVGPMTRLRPPPVSAIGLGHAVSVGIATFTIALAVALVGASLRLGRMSSGVRDRNVFVSVIYLPT